MIACVQMKLKAEDYHSEESFQNRINDLMNQVRQETGPGPLLTVFPEHIGTFCLLCNEGRKVWSSRSFAEAISNLVKDNFSSVAYQKIFKKVSWAKALILARSAQAERIYLTAFQNAAKEHQAWIVAGSAALRQGKSKQVFNTAPLITPEGTVLFRQSKVHLVDMEQKEGLDLDSARTSEIKVTDSFFGKLGIAVCLDAFQEEIRQRLQALGAQVFIQPSANNGPWNEWQQEDWLRSSYRAVYEQKEFALAINPMLVGNLWDLTFAGQSAIITEEGYAARAQSSDQEEILIRKDLLNGA